MPQSAVIAPAGESHAMTRLAERYGVRLSRWEMRQVRNMVRDGLATWEPRARLGRRGQTAWWVDLSRFAGRAVEALAVYNPDDNQIITFLPRDAAQLKGNRA